MKQSLLALALTAGFVTLPAAASNVSVNIGAIGVMPNDSSSSLDVVESVAGLETGSTQAHVNDNVQLGITIDYAFNPNWTLELVAATPFSHDITVQGSAIHGLNIGKTKHLPPSLLLQYHFPTQSRIKPFVGLGVNYTVFFDEETNGELEGALTDLGVMTAADELSLSLSDSWGAAVQLGANIELSERLGLHFMLSKMKIDTTAKVKLNDATIQKVDVTIDPLVAMAGIRIKI